LIALEVILTLSSKFGVYISNSFQIYRFDRDDCIEIFCFLVFDVILEGNITLYYVHTEIFFDQKTSS